MVEVVVPFGFSKAGFLSGCPVELGSKYLQITVKMCECEDERGRAPTGLSISLSFKKNVWHTKRAILGHVYVQNIYKKNKNKMFFFAHFFLADFSFTFDSITLRGLDTRD